MNKIDSRTDWLLDSCYTTVLSVETIQRTSLLDKNGVLRGRALWFNVIVDEYGTKQDTEERICNKCWVSDLSQFEFITLIIVNH